MTGLLVGVDIGGTFTDCVVLDAKGRITATKCPSTPDNFANGMLAAMGLAADVHAYEQAGHLINV